MLTHLKVGLCSTCGRGPVRLDRHHCHLRDAVRARIQRTLIPRIGREATNKAFQQHSAWSEDARVIRLMRFDPVRICRKCNTIDVCDQGSKLGPYFSLSPDEIYDVRLATNNAKNKGLVFRNTLAAVRDAAVPDYLMRLPQALLLGQIIALEWLIVESGDATPPTAGHSQACPKQTVRFAAA